MNIKASIIGLIATTLLSSAMIANAAPVKMAAKPALHASKTTLKHPLKHVMKRRHAKPGARVNTARVTTARVTTARVTTTKMTHRLVKVRHMKKVRHAAKTR